MIKTAQAKDQSPLETTTLPRIKRLSAVMAVYCQGMEDLRKEILTSGLRDLYALEFLRDEGRFRRMSERMAEDFGDDVRKVRQAIQKYKGKHER